MYSCVGRHLIGIALCVSFKLWWREQLMKPHRQEEQRTCSPTCLVLWSDLIWSISLPLWCRSNHDLSYKILVMKVLVLIWKKWFSDSVNRKKFSLIGSWVSEQDKYFQAMPQCLLFFACKKLFLCQLHSGQGCMRYVEQPVQFLYRCAFRRVRGKGRAQSTALLCKHKEMCFSSNTFMLLNLK